jgi:arylsulfatase A-like enzyme
MSTRPRHVIWITCDHLRWDNIGAHGVEFAHTPAIDRLVREGVSFNNCFAQNPLCMPSRASFMTGCYPHQVGVLDNGQELDPNCPLSVARCFKAAGYQTAQIGKLHFQSHEDNDLDPRTRHDYGFDVFWCDEEPGCYEGPYLRWLASEDPSLVSLFRTPRPVAPGRQDGTDHKVLDAPWRYSFSGWIAEQARRYLSSWGGARGRHERHFLHLGFYAPHPPLNPTADMMAPLAGREPPSPIGRDGEHEDKPGLLGAALRQARLDSAQIASYRRHFAAMVTGVDFAVAHLLETLEELGVADDTLIVFGSDHGDFCGDHGLILKGPAWYDSVARVPLVLRWPNGLSSAQRVEGLVEMVDALPTLLGLVGQPVPRAMAGRDLSAQLLAGDTNSLGREDVLAVHGPGHIMLRSERYKYLRYHNGDDAPDEVLYDLRSDPDELVNVAEHPDHRAALDHMRRRSFSRLVDAIRPTTPRVYRF